MQAFSGSARVPESRFIVPAMVDLQNLRELGKGGGEGAGERGECFSSPLSCPLRFLSAYYPPLGRTFYSPQSSPAFKIQDGGCSVRSPKNIFLRYRLLISQWPHF